jgi:tetratricopeptide (TPR) repeat protein
MAKQVNKSFLILLVILVLGGIGGALVVYKKPWRKVPKPEEFMARGEAAMKDKKYEEARDNFAAAWRLSTSKIEPLTRFGDALYQLAKTDPENTQRAIAQWNQALSIDPTYGPALTSKMNALIDEMEAIPRADNFVAARDAATQLAKLDPTNTRAAAYQYIATLSAWYNNVQTDPAKITEAVEGLQGLIKSDPANADLPYHVARAHIQFGQDETRAGRRADAMARYTEAAAVVDKAAADQNANPLMLLRAGQIYDLLDLLIDRNVSKGAYDRASGAYFERARELVKSEDATYQEIQEAYAARKVKLGERAVAEKIYRDLLRRKPDDVALRIVLAEILQTDRSTRKEAADMLADTVRESESTRAKRSAVALRLQYRAILRLASIRMDLLEDLRDDQNRLELMRQIEADIAKAEARMPENADTLKIRGRLQLIKRDTVSSLQTLTKAAQLLDSNAARHDFELMYSLARANLAARNNAEARRLLEHVVRGVPNFVPARLLLVDLLVSSNERIEADKHLDELERLSPDSPLVARFRIFTLDPVKDKQQVESYYARLSEGSREEKLEKARIAIVIERLNEGARLLEMVRAASPNDTGVADRLARLYIGMNQRDKAKDVIQSTLNLVPNDPQLTLLLKRLNQATAEDLFAISTALIKETPDPLMRALQMADLERLRGNAVGHYNELIAAEKIAPNDPRVQDGLFSYYLATRQWEAALKYIEPLAKANYGGSHGLIYWWKYFAHKGDYGQAVQIGVQFTQKMPQFAVSWITLGQAHKMRGEYQEALAAFNSAREKQSTNRDAMRGAIDCLYALGRHSEAKKIIDEAVKYYPLDLGLQEMLVEYELKYGDPRRVKDKLIGNIEREPNQLVHYLNASSMYYHLATKPNTSEEARAEWLKQGTDVLKKAVDRFPDEPRAYIALAQMQAAAKQREAGEATLTAMVENPKLKDMAEPKLIMAEYYIKGNESPKAEKLLRDAMAVAPESQEIRRKLAVFLSDNKRVDEALQVIDQAGEQAKEPMLITSKAEILTGAGRHAEVEQLANEGLRSRPDELGLLAILANAQFNQGKFAAAIATSDRVLAKDPKNSRALIARGMAKMRRPNGDPADALPDLIAYRDQNLNDHKVRVLLAEVYNRKQRFAEAMVETQAAVNLSPNDPQLRAGLLETYRMATPVRLAEGDQLVKDAQSVEILMSNPDWLVAESTWLVFRKQNQRAVEVARRAMTLQPKDGRYLQHYLGTLLNTRSENDLLSETDAMLAANPKRWWIYQARGLAKKRLGDATAEAEFVKAVNVALEKGDIESVEIALRTMAREVGADKALAVIRPRVGENIRYSLVTAQLYIQRNDTANAVKIIDEAMAARVSSPAPTQAVVLAYAGAVYATTKPPMTDKAINAYQELVKLQPDNVEALNQLAWLLADLSPTRATEALPHSSRAYQLVADSGRFSTSVFDTHGWVLVLCGKLKDGIAVLELVVEKHPTIDAHWHLSEAYRRDGQKDKADAQLQKAEELIKDHDTNKIPVDADLRQKVRDAAARAAASIQ